MAAKKQSIKAECEKACALLAGEWELAHFNLALSLAQFDAATYRARRAVSEFGNAVKRFKAKMKEMKVSKQ
jgi:inorganic triphosphatase YgiF